MVGSVFCLMNINWFKLSICLLLAIQLGQSFAERVDGVKVLNDALSLYRETEYVQAVFRVPTDEVELVTYIYNSPDDFFYRLRRTDRVELRDGVIDESKPVQSFLYKGGNTWFLDSVKGIAVECEFRWSKFPETLPLFVDADLDSYIATESYQRTIDGVEFLSVTRTLTEDARVLIRKYSIDPYFYRFGLVVDTGIKKSYEIEELHYVIRVDDLRIYSWKVTTTEGDVVTDSRYDEVEMGVPFDAQDMFAIPDGYRRVVAKTQEEFTDYLVNSNLDYLTEGKERHASFFKRIVDWCLSGPGGGVVVTLVLVVVVVVLRKSLWLEVLRGGGR